MSDLKQNAGLKNDMMTLLSQVDDEGRYPLHHVAMQSKTSLLKYLIKQGAELDAADQDGNTPLHLAVQEGQVENIRVLLDAGANVSRANIAGDTPQDMACQMDMDAIVTLFEQTRKDKPVSWGNFEHKFHPKGPFGP